MNKNKLYDLYEKTYFYEMEVREKLVGRVQMNFALVFTGYAVICYMLRMLDFGQASIVVDLFIFFVVMCFIPSTICIIHLVKAFWGNEYEGIPTGIKINSYREKLIVYKDDIEKYNNEYPEAKQEEVKVGEIVENFIYTKFRDCSSYNTETNDKRSKHIHKSFKWLLYSSIPFFLASLFFIVGDLDVSSPRKETLISNKKLTEQLIKTNLTLEKISKSIQTIKGKNMSNNKTPPPPPPPSQPQPRRLIENNSPQSNF